MFDCSQVQSVLDQFMLTLAKATTAYNHAVALSRLIPTTASLVVVPDHMKSHWANMIKDYVGRREGSRYGIVDDDGIPGMDDTSGRVEREAYCDGMDQAFPTTEELRNKYWVIVLSTKRFTDAEMNLKTPESRLFKFQWPRVFLDEGDTMGNSSLSNTRSNLQRLSIVRPWIVTGTPTPIKGGQSSLPHLNRLLQFIEEVNPRKFKKLIQTPIEHNSRSDAGWNLQHVLQRSMVMHQKTEMLVPQPVLELVVVDLSPLERDTYNAGAGLILLNLMLNQLCVAEHGTWGDEEALKADDGWKECYLNWDNYDLAGGRGAKPSVRKLREACSCGNKAVLSVSLEDRLGVLERLQAEPADAAVTTRVENFCRNLHSNTEKCDACGRCLAALTVTFCGHLVCPECMIKEVGGLDELPKCDPNRVFCPVADCRERIDIVDYAELQPGMRVRFEAVPGYDLETPDWWNVESNPAAHSKGMYIVRQIEALDKHKAATNTPYKVIIFSQFKQTLYQIGDKLVRRAVQKYDNVGHDQVGNVSTEAVMKAKKNQTADILATTDTKGYRSVGDYQFPDPVVREGELDRFCNDDDCTVLLLGGEHTDGLDLSIVTHLYIVDEVWDHSKWEQLVARASRLGARNPVRVMRLVAKGTVEQDLATINDTGSAAALNIRQRTMRMLKAARFVNSPKRKVTFAAPAHSGDAGGHTTHSSASSEAPKTPPPSTTPTSAPATQAAVPHPGHTTAVPASDAHAAMSHAVHTTVLPDGRTLALDTAAHTGMDTSVDSATKSSALLRGGLMAGPAPTTHTLPHTSVPAHAAHTVSSTPSQNSQNMHTHVQQAVPPETEALVAVLRGLDLSSFVRRLYATVLYNTVFRHSSPRFL